MQQRELEILNRGRSRRVTVGRGCGENVIKSAKSLKRVRAVWQRSAAERTLTSRHFPHARFAADDSSARAVHFHRRARDVETECTTKRITGSGCERFGGASSRHDARRFHGRCFIDRIAIVMIPIIMDRVAIVIRIIIQVNIVVVLTVIIAILEKGFAKDKISLK